MANFSCSFPPGGPRKANSANVGINSRSGSCHTDTTETLGKPYIEEIVRLHGIPGSIVSDRDPNFCAKYWEGLQLALGTRSELSTAFHPQTDGAIRTNYSDLGGYAENMCSRLSRNVGRTIYLPQNLLYNNGFQSRIKIAPYEALYGRPYRSPLCWAGTFTAPKIRVHKLLLLSGF